MMPRAISDHTGISGVRKSYGRTFADFYVETARSGRMYLSAEHVECFEEQRRIVFVESDRFLALWRADPYGHTREVSSGGPETWVNHAKYPSAAEGFARGQTDPVPLAYVHCCEAQACVTRPRRIARSLGFGRFMGGIQHISYVAFTNGITRTIWLLVNGAKVFPVWTDKEGAQRLHEHAGVDGLPVLTAGDVIARNVDGRGSAQSR